MIRSISGIVMLLCCLMFTTGCTSVKKKQPSLHFYPEEEVIIKGYNRDAMEPFITSQGDYLFFNSLNDGIDTCLYYAEKINDTTFSFKGKIKGVNGSPPHLDAVASMDSENRFYYVSTRNYPAAFENYRTGYFAAGEVTRLRQVKGSMYIYLPGWIIMDGEISRGGRSLYYVNARFAGKGVPEQASLSIAVKEENVFNKLPSSDTLLEKINDPAYLIYAPCISSDEKELFFTRHKKGTSGTEICYALRSRWNEPFGEPQIIPISGTMAEGPSLTNDGKRLYYHKKLEQDGKYHIFTIKRK